MTNYILTHGFNVKDAGKGTIDKLIQYGRRMDRFQQADYGYFNLLGVRWFNKSIATTLAGMANDGSVGIGHSNGCAILVEAIKHTDKIKQLILINPALDVDTVFADSVHRIDVFHNVTDNVVTASKWLPWHVWGEMGRVGYQGDDSRICNWETNKLYGAEGHSGVLHDNAKDMMDMIRMVEL